MNEGCYLSDIPTLGLLDRSVLQHIDTGDGKGPCLLDTRDIRACIDCNTIFSTVASQQEGLGFEPPDRRLCVLPMFDLFPWVDVNDNFFENYVHNVIFETGGGEY